MTASQPTAVESDAVVSSSRQRSQRYPALRVPTLIAVVSWIVLFLVLVAQTNWNVHADWWIAGGIATVVYFVSDGLID